MNVGIIIYFSYLYCFTHLIVEVYLYPKTFNCSEKVVTTISNTKQGITHNKESNKTQSNKTTF
jgi:hypothetical protein